MHAKGVRCTDCHDPHTAKILAKGNQLCVRCHIPAKYDSYAHHYHPAGSTGSQCVECHMPETTYMTVDPRRDHSFRIPRPDQTISMGLPNACNRCHKDKTPEWSLESVIKWYPKHEWPRRTDFAKAIEGGRQQDPTQEKPLIRYARDPLMPTLLRASAFSLLGNYESAETTEALIAGTTDPDILAKIEVARAFEPRLQAAAANYSSAGGLSSEYRAQVAAVAKLLGDNARSVRTEAARALAAVPKAEIPAESRDAYDVALAQCIEDMKTQQDVPVANYNLANLYANLGKPAEAEKFYRAALKLDPSYNVARFNLAMLLYQQNRPAEAIREFQSVLAWAEKGLRTGDDAVTSWNNSLASRTHYSLGLLLAEDPARLDQAAVHLSEAAKLDPNAHRALYNLGLAYQQQQRWEEAEKMLRQAQAKQPDDADYLYALGILAAQRNRPEDARRWLMALVQRYPQHVDGQMLLQRLSRP
jgi:predicted CXXCH cytochrome family protein